MKHIFLTYLLFINAIFCAQNLVPNPSFEEYYDCSMPGYFNNVKYWVNPTDYSPDYLNVCDATTNGYGVPYNSYGFQNARTGVAYVGVISMIETDGREYIQAELIESLIAGKQYLVTFYVSVGEICTYASNNIGAYISNTPVSAANSWVLPYTLQISNNHLLNPLSDIANWTEVSDTLIALGGEKYITIGNFNYDTATDTTPLIPSDAWWNASYHFIDDVSVICLDCAVGISETTIDNRISIFPNPTSDYLNISFDNIFPERITLFNSMGAILFEKAQTLNNGSIQINISQYHSGIYFLKIDANNISITKRFLINQ